LCFAAPRLRSARQYAAPSHSFVPTLRRNRSKLKIGKKIGKKAAASALIIERKSLIALAFYASLPAPSADVEFHSSISCACGPGVREALGAGFSVGGDCIRAPALGLGTPFRRWQLGERTGRTVMAQLLKDGLLVSDTPKGELRIGLPLDALNILLPNLYPEASTQVVD
jgi:hypothetical protein